MYFTGDIVIAEAVVTTDHAAFARRPYVLKTYNNAAAFPTVRQRALCAWYSGTGPVRCTEQLETARREIRESRIILYFVY